MVGYSDTRLVFLRGNSAAGKSTVAKLLRERVGRGVALIEQDYLRRTVLREHDRPGLPNIGLIDAVIRYSLDAGYHVVADGIFGSARYESMLRRLAADHVGLTAHYYFDIPLAETQRRHLTKPSVTVDAEQLRKWYQLRDVLSYVEESMVTAAETAEEIVSRMLKEVDFCDPPIASKLEREMHIE